ncbi:MAG: lyase family protein, partial [Candidatus Uhrbacteria bacterium]
MRRLWSLDHRFHVQRQVWVAQAKAQLVAGLASEEQIAELASLIDDTNIAEVFRKEKTTKHDIVAALEHFKDQAPLGGNLLHQGMTSEDNTSNLDIILIRNSLELIIEELENLLRDFAVQIEKFADLRCCGFTHWQAASTTTVGYRLAMYATDLMIDLQELRSLRNILLPKGLKGAVGTRSTLCKMLKKQDMTPNEFEYAFLQELGLPNSWTVTGQTYTRKIDLRVFTALASLSQSLHKFGQDMRLLKSTPFNEMTVLFTAGQKG